MFLPLQLSLTTAGLLEILWEMSVVLGEMYVARVKQFGLLLFQRQLEFSEHGPVCEIAVAVRWSEQARLLTSIGGTLLTSIGGTLLTSTGG